MKNLIMFFTGIILLGLAGAALYLSGAVFDAGGQRYIEAFVFQPNNLSEARIGRPVPVEQLSDKFIRERLIRKFVHEYFHVIPDGDDIARRTRADSVMAQLAASAVFSAWKQGEARDIETLSGKKTLRTVVVGDIILPPGSDYWEVHYDLYTWPQANDMDLTPAVTSGLMHLKISFARGVLGQKFDTDEFLKSGGENNSPGNPAAIPKFTSKRDIGKYLSEGGDPAVIFRFLVDEVKR